MPDSIFGTQVNLDGLLEVLGKNLYSTPSVALRELIQNAHDACERLSIESDLKPEFAIEVYTDDQTNTLTIRDNGSGLTQQEIIDFLATVGSGYTRKLRDTNASNHMIGYFGLGFLSAYVVASKVEVMTTSFQQPKKSCLFTSHSGKSYSIKQCATVPIGSTIILQLKKEYADLAKADIVDYLLSKYCCLLPINIYLNPSTVSNAETRPLNHLVAPWLLATTTSKLQIKKQTLAFAQHFEANFEPLWCFNLPQDNAYELQGTLWIQDGSSYASSDNRNVFIFIHGMFISSEINDLLPTWAGFMGAVLESSNFKPTASREDLQRDDYYQKVKAYIKEQIALALRNMVLNEPEAWRRVLFRHSEALLGGALADTRLFEVAKRSIKVPTSMGRLTLPEIVRLSNNKIYIKESMDSGFEETLFKTQKIPLVLGYLYGATEFCRRFAHSETYTFYVLGSEDSENAIFKPAQLEQRSAQLLVDLFQQEREQVKLSHFNPVSIPLIIIDDETVKLKKKIENDEMDKRMGSAALSLARLHTHTIDNVIERRIYINCDNPSIKLIFSCKEQQRSSIAKLLRAFTESIHHQVDNENRSFLDVIDQFNQALSHLTHVTHIA